MITVLSRKHSQMLLEFGSSLLDLDHIFAYQSICRERKFAWNRITIISSVQGDTLTHQVGPNIMLS